MIVKDDGSEKGNGDRYPDEDGIVHDGGKLSVYCPRICESVRFPLDRIICASTEHPAAILGLGVAVGCDSSLFSSELVGAMEVDDDDVPSLTESAVRRFAIRSDNQDFDDRMHRKRTGDRSPAAQLVHDQKADGSEQRTVSEIPR